MSSAVKIMKKCPKNFFLVSFHSLSCQMLINFQANEPLGPSLGSKNGGAYERFMPVSNSQYQYTFFCYKQVFYKQPKAQIAENLSVVPSTLSASDLV